MRRHFALVAAGMVGVASLAIWGHVGAVAAETIGFINYPAPADDAFYRGGVEQTLLGLPRRAAGETSIGVNRASGAVMVQLLLTTARVIFDDSQDPPAATWTDVSYPPNSQLTADPILWTDPSTGRTFVAHDLVAGGSIAYTDDDGASWQLTQPPTGLPSWDHPTVGGGPYAPGLIGSGPIYPNAVYYCVSVGAPTLAQCARSDTGGLAWGPPLPSSVDQCHSTHGHVAVGLDGTVYIPFRACLGQGGSWSQGVLASENNGVTWERRTVSSTFPATSDPAVALDAGGRLYLATTMGGKPVVAASDDGGRYWSGIQALGSTFGVQNTAFPMVVAGDAGRAAVAFYGTTMGGDDQRPDFAGAWRVYVALTFDGGATWTTIDLTPDDPVQRGTICLLGISCASGRNLLDFQGMTIDGQGRVLVSYADGCTSAACVGLGGDPGDSTDSLGTIARQTTGKRLFAAFDPPDSDVVGVPGDPPPVASASCIPQAGTPGCMPTSEQCASGDYNNGLENLYWDGGKPGRLAVCEDLDGVLLLYAGGNLTVPCGVIIVADKEIAASIIHQDDPNLCDAAFGSGIGIGSAPVGHPRIRRSLE